MSLPRTTDQRSELAEALADPQVAHNLTVILEHADLLALMVESVSGLIERGDDLLDVGMELADELRTTITSAPLLNEPSTAQLLDSARRLAATLPALAPALAVAAESGTFEALVGSDLLNPRTVDQMSIVARGLVAGAERHQTHPINMGNPLTVAKLLRDPDVARSLSFFACVAKALGQELDRSPAPDQRAESASATA